MDAAAGRVRLLLVVSGRDDARVLDAPVSDDAAVLADRAGVHVRRTFIGRVLSVVGWWLGG